MRNAEPVRLPGEPRYTEMTIRWYSAKDTTPLALCGHIGDVLAAVDPEEFFGDEVITCWFGENGYDWEGQTLAAGAVRSFAIPVAPGRMGRRTRG